MTLLITVAESVWLILAIVTSPESLQVVAGVVGVVAGVVVVPGTGVVGVVADVEVVTGAGLVAGIGMVGGVGSGGIKGFGTPTKGVNTAENLKFL